MSDRATLIHGDALQSVATLADESIDSIVTDPPAGIGFMGKEWDSDKGGRDRWVAWLRDIMREALRVLRPGGHALVWAMPRTSHWTATALEDAGFEIRDVVTHLFGTGFPKSKNIGAGRGTALKPASEHWILCRRPLIGTVAANVLAHGTGALNIDACRLDGVPRTTHADGNRQPSAPQPMSLGVPTEFRCQGATGRWPANVTIDEEAAALLDAQSGIRRSAGNYPSCSTARDGVTSFAGRQGKLYADTGGASRFFYVAKGSKPEKTAGGAVANTHPTAKGVSLMRWLVRLITPPGGVVLDMFAGSGTTGVAALAEGCRFVGVEQSDEYMPILDGRIRHALGAT